MDKNLKTLFKKLKAQGWEIRPTKKGEFAIPPDETKPLVLIHNTARGSRSWENMIAELKRSGFKEHE